MSSAGTTTIAITLLLACACSGYDAPTVRRVASTEPEDVGYGFSHAVTKDNFDDAVGTRLGHASGRVDGHTIKEIVTDPSLRVRGDDRACVDCHAWAPGISRRSFCERVDDFVRQPTAGTAHDPENAKPELFKELLSRWKASGCPD